MWAAATAVIAGVCRSVRCSPFLEYCPQAVVIVRVVGGRY